MHTIQWIVYSFALWTRPISFTTGGTILHVSEATNNGGWCVPFIGRSSVGQLAIASWNGDLIEVLRPYLKVGQWIHIVKTYSQSHRILYAQSSAFNYLPSGVSMVAILGQSFAAGANFAHSTILPASYYGEIDEFYIYIRELSQADITA